MKNSFEERYGKTKGIGVLIGYSKNHPEAWKKALATAGKPGHGGITPHSKSKIVSKMLKKRGGHG
jgi:hypothetical protein